MQIGWHSGGRTYFSVSRATRMLSRVSLGGPCGTVGGSIVPIPACGATGLDDPGTTEVSSPCGERMDSELSALPLTSAPVASREELENKNPKVFELCSAWIHFLWRSSFYKDANRISTSVGRLPASGGVCSALRDPGCGRSVCERRGHGGGGVSLGDRDLLGLAGLLSTVGTEALTFQHRGTSAMETVRDADIWLALHEGPLHEAKTNKKNTAVSVSKK